MTRHVIQRLPGPNDSIAIQQVQAMPQMMAGEMAASRAAQSSMVGFPGNPPPPPPFPLALPAPPLPPSMQHRMAAAQMAAGRAAQRSTATFSVNAPPPPPPPLMRGCSGGPPLPPPPIHYPAISAKSSHGPYIDVRPKRYEPQTLVSHENGPEPQGWTVYSDFQENGSMKRNDLHAQLVASILKKHSKDKVYPVSSFNLHGYQSTGNISVEPLSSVHDGTGLSFFQYIPPVKRSDSSGGIGKGTTFESNKVTYKGREFTTYSASWTEGYTIREITYFVYDGGEKDEELIEQLAIDCGNWQQELGNRIWVFDMGYWQQDSNLWRSVQKSNWKDIILPQDLKDGVVHDFVDFFNGKQTYLGMGVPWKRGLILYGPPGNGKTITLKALMKQLGGQKDPIPTLYVKSFFSWGGDQAAIREIFQKARQQAPCMLILEDLDSLITGANRSFFLNELDGLEDNDGLLVVGTTNHADRLDPGISKRPSRFDRKYLFDDPAKPERVQYVKYWRSKLEDTPVDFPDSLVEELAELLHEFSFAYMKEAFVSTLLYIAARRDDRKDDDEWAKQFEPTIKKQIKELRKQIEDGDDDKGTAVPDPVTSRADPVADINFHRLKVLESIKGIKGSDGDETTAAPVPAKEMARPAAVVQPSRSELLKSIRALKAQPSGRSRPKKVRRKFEVQDFPSRIEPYPSTPFPRGLVTMTRRDLTFWKNGFSIDDGPFISYDDPNYYGTLHNLEVGRASLHLLNVEPGQPTSVRVFKKGNEDHKAFQAELLRTLS